MLQAPLFCTDQSYPFSALRLLTGSLTSPGVVDSGDMLVSAAGGLQVSIAAGLANVQQTVATEGAFYANDALYLCPNDAPASPYNTILAPTGNPRVDQVILRVYDVSEQGLSGSSFCRFEWLTGIETPGCNVTPGASGFLAGAASLPANSLRLAAVLQTVGESSISSGNILNMAPLSGAAGVRRLMMTTLGSLSGGMTYSTGGQDLILLPQSNPVASGLSLSATDMPPAWLGDNGYSGQPQDFQLASKTAYGRVRAALVVNGTAPSVNASVGLYVITGLGGSSVMQYTFGSALAGSSTGAVPLTTANSVYGVESGPFPLPANLGGHMLGINLSGGAGTLTSGSVVHITAQLYSYNA